MEKVFFMNKSQTKKNMFFRAFLRQRPLNTQCLRSVTTCQQPQHNPITTSPDTSNPWQVCVGIEIHAQLMTNTKLFSASSSTFEMNSNPNTQVSYFDAALPGTLPVLNEECVDQAIRSALSLRATVHPHSRFERKHYFYADLPLGFQITQQESCIATNGTLNITVPKTRNNAERFDVYERDVRIARLQLEQDSGKSMHDYDPSLSMIDLNRAGCALVEIVSEPDLRSSDEAACYVRKIQQLLRHVGACDGNMDEGSLRCDVNISVRPVPVSIPICTEPLEGIRQTMDNKKNMEDKNDKNDKNDIINDTIQQMDQCQQNPTDVEDNQYANIYAMGERVEVKNLNSVRSVVRAIDYEVERQIYNAEMKNAVVTKHETRTFDVSTGETIRMRSKEDAPDYRFLLDPDLPPLVLKKGTVERISNSLPELPDAIRIRLMQEYDLSLYDASVLVEEDGAAEYFEMAMQQLLVLLPKNTDKKKIAKQALNWITNELLGRMRACNHVTMLVLLGRAKRQNHNDVGANHGVGLTPLDLAALMFSLLQGEISGKIVKNALDVVFEDIVQQEEKMLIRGSSVNSNNSHVLSSLSPMEVIEREGWAVVRDVDALRELCLGVVDDIKNQKQVDLVRSGEKPKLVGFFVGQVMKASKGQADPATVKQLLEEILLKKTVNV
jgi:aspartyl-tRNA(Asn)/glutamyl-tRNA(Gln) amidotransferase subunit B